MKIVRIKMYKICIGQWVKVIHNEREGITLTHMEEFFVLMELYLMSGIGEAYCHFSFSPFLSFFDVEKNEYTYLLLYEKRYRNERMAKSH